MTETNMALVKFKMLVEDIDMKLKAQGCAASPFYSKPLQLIFDNQPVNEYRKTIFANASLRVLKSFEHGNWYNADYNLKYMGMDHKMPAIKAFVTGWKDINNTEEPIRFIFWALLAACIDKTDFESNISRIADFIKLFGISEDTLRDIISIIRVVFEDIDEMPKFNTNEVPEIFRRVLVRNNK